MPKTPSPFAGLKLTDQTSLGGSGVDQKLFSRPTPLPARPVSQDGQEKEETPKPPAPTLVKPQKRVAIEPAASEAKGFDLNLPTEKSETFAFTFEEWLALDQLKTELTRLLGVDLRVTKIDIIRCALYMIVNDYRQRGEQSFLVDRIKNKKPVDRIRRKKVR
jgi:hypothetical protein